MSAPDKPDPASAWTFVEQLLAEEELERLDKLGDKDLTAEMHAQGRNAADLPSADVLLARVRAAPENLNGNGRGKQAAKARARRRRWLVAAAIAAAVAAVLSLEGPAIVAHFKRVEPIGPDNEMQQPQPSPRELAQKLRDEAVGACGDGLWALCQRKLDAAHRLDPAGEEDPRVKKARGDIERGLHGDHGGKDKPPGP
jgi:hypothetical protein